MSFRKSLLKSIESIRSIAGPKGLDVRPHQLTIRTRTWSGRQVDDGTPTDSDLVLPGHYIVRLVSGEEVASSGGRYLTDDVTVEHITPFNGVDAGYTPEQLSPTVTTENVEIIYLLSGDTSGEYTLTEGKFFRAFSYSLVLRRSRRTP